MISNPNDPRPYDAVIGGKNPPLNSAVLGGISGLKKRLKHDNKSVQLKALKESIKYGEEGVIFLLEVLTNEKGFVQRIAWDLLWAMAKESGKKKLIPYAPLPSAIGVNYRPLEKLLAAGKWQEADKETARMTLIIANREKEGWLRLEDISNIPCEDLRTIDKLWVTYSHGRFGFSVQNEIYTSLGARGKYDEKMTLLFGDRVGWHRPNLINLNNSSYQLDDTGWLDYYDLIFNLQAPRGHLPLLTGLLEINELTWIIQENRISGRRVFVLHSCLMKRMLNCCI
jgi:GUN4-like